MRRKCIISILIISLLFCNPLSLIKSNTAYASAEISRTFDLYSSCESTQSVIYDSSRYQQYLDSMMWSSEKVTVLTDENENVTKALLYSLDGKTYD